MRILALGCLFFAVGCTAFDGVVADVPGDALTTAQSPTDPAKGSGTTTQGGTPARSAASADAANPAPSAPSCARVHGGLTCGPDGNDDCCAIAKQGDAKLNKYQITAGRMRAFVEKVNGDVAGWVKTLPAGKWNSAWPTDVLPTDRASADVALGPAGKKACQQGQNTGHTFWTPPTNDDKSEYDQATLDEKALNCVPWPLAQAMCVFDGGRLASHDELRAAFTNGGKTKFPWGDDGVNVTGQDERWNNEFIFETENPATFKGKDHPSEVSFFIAPPGRFPKGNNEAGIADAAGNLLEWVTDAPRQFVWKGDFEEHAANAQTFSGSVWMDKTPGVLGIGASTWIWGTNQLVGNAGNADQKDGYYAIGGRCSL